MANIFGQIVEKILWSACFAAPTFSLLKVHANLRLQVFLYNFYGLEVVRQIFGEGNRPAFYCLLLPAYCFSVSASTPGNCMPERNSRDAPPPVEM